MEQVKNIIDGHETPALSGKTFENVNPATEEIIAEVASSGAEDVDAAVQAAQAAFDAGWGRMPAMHRASVLKNLAGLIAGKAAELAQVESQDVGKPIKAATEEAFMAAYLFDYAAGLCGKAHGTFYPADNNYICYSTYEPMGVAACIIPWNYPMVISAGKVPMALAAGNTVIVKPSKHTPMSMNSIGKLALEAGLPPGVINVIHGPGGAAGQAIAEHPGIPKISFTGSTSVGKRILKAGADTVKSITLELGGKNANLVFEDADMNAAVHGSLFTAFKNTGQICTSGSKILVQESIAEEFTAALIAKAQKLVVGPPGEMTTDLGPVINKPHYEDVKGFIATGEKECELIYRGELGKGAEKGYFLPINIFKLTDPSSRLFTQEIFGPVLTITTFKDEKEAVALANHATYGLASMFWTKDLGRANRLSHALESGVVWGNTCHYGIADVPCGGHKQSGLGLEMGVEGLKGFMNVKSVFLNAGPDIMTLMPPQS